MNKKLLELLDSINEKKSLVRNLVEQGKLEDAAREKEELIKLQSKFDLLKDIEDGEIENKGQELKRGALRNVNPKDAVKEFADAARRGFKVSNDMKEGTKEDGGYMVPEDIRTRIEKRRESRDSLIEEVTIEPVSTNKGSRTFKKRSQQTGFEKVGEGGKIGKKNTPKFERMDYEIEKYAGWFPVTNELLEDSDETIASTLVEWIGDESRVTRNNVIREAINTKEKTTFKGLDDIKKALNVTLGAAFKSTSKIITNDDGLQYLDTLKDAEGKYLLQPNPAEPMQLRLCAGATIVPVKIIGNKDLPSDTATVGKRKIPVIVGDLKEGIKFFDRKQLSIFASNIAQAGNLNAFEEDLTLFRAIEREDCRIKDKEAFVNGEIIINEENAEENG